MAYSIQGRSTSIGAQPQIRDGRTYVPLRDLTEQLGGSVSWDNNSKQATASIGQWTATVNPSDTHVDVSGVAVTLQAAPFVDEEGNLWVPASFFHDAFGYNVQINGNDISIVNPQVAAA